jgi:hypothetical protein
VGVYYCADIAERWYASEQEDRAGSYEPQIVLFYPLKVCDSQATPLHFTFLIQ